MIADLVDVIPVFAKRKTGTQRQKDQRSLRLWDPAFPEAGRDDGLRSSSRN